MHLRFNKKKVEKAALSYSAIGKGGTPKPFIKSVFPEFGSKKGGTQVVLKTNVLPKKDTELFINGKPHNIVVLPGEIKLSMPPGQGIAKLWLAVDGKESNQIEFQYVADSKAVKWEYRHIAHGPYVRVEFCYGYLFTAEYATEETLTPGVIKQWEIMPNYSLKLKKNITAVIDQAPGGASGVTGLTCDPTWS